MHTLKHKTRHLATAITLALLSTHAQAASITPPDQYAWSETSGWLNFAATNSNVAVLTDHLEGYVWAENIGWIRLGTASSGAAHTYTNANASTYGVNRASDGKLSGYGWSETSGWINFGATDGNAKVADDGTFSGYSWGENIGWISLAGTATDTSTTAYKVKAAALISPTNGSITLNGTAKQGQTLTASITDNDGTTNATITYVWKRGTVTISGATGSSYTLTDADVGNAITVTASYTDDAGTQESVTATTATVAALTTDEAVSLTINGVPVTGGNATTPLNTPAVGSTAHYGTHTVSALTTPTDIETKTYTLTGAAGSADTLVTLSVTEVEATATGWLPKLNKLLANLNPITNAQAVGAEDFEVNPSSVTVKAGESVPFSVTFAPTAVGLREAYINFSTNGEIFNRIRVAGQGLSASVGAAAPQNIPVFGPLGLLASLLGLLWVGRRRKC